jgi:hypothetical protein
MAGPSPDNLVDVTIRVDPKESDEKFREIVRLLEKRGLKGAVHHARFRMINGSVRAEDLAALRDVPGVVSVREDQVYGPR